jgi:hypothetical protein
VAEPILRNRVEGCEGRGQAYVRRTSLAQGTGPARVLLACIARNPWLVFDAIGPRRLDGAPHATPASARVALMIRRKSPAAREAAAGPSGGSPRESRGTGRAGAIGSQIASRRKLAIPVYVPSISVH